MSEEVRGLCVRGRMAGDTGGNPVRAKGGGEVSEASSGSGARPVPGSSDGLVAGSSVGPTSSSAQSIASSSARGGSSAAERAYRHLRDAILEGELAAGEMLGESGLADRLGMSRTPVRAALVRLQDEQWVTIYPKRGALVNGLSVRDIAEVADARYVLEAAAVQRATPGMIERLVPRLEESLKAQARALAAQDLRAFIDATTGFHRMFVEVSGNDVLLEMSDRLADRRRYMLFRQGERLIERREEMLAEHRELIDALRERDVVRFAEALRGHLRDTHEAAVDPVTFVP